jgi:histidine triad (HIT) family protein
MCIFCQIASWESPSWTIYQDELVTAFFDYFPASSGHLVIVPNEHHENIFEIPEDTLSHLAKVSKRIALTYKNVLWIENINILQNNGLEAWQTVFHYHMHLIPRSEWDNVALSWKYDEGLRSNYDELKATLSAELK